MCGGSATLTAGYLRVEVPPGAQMDVTISVTGTPIVPGWIGDDLIIHGYASLLGPDGGEVWEVYKGYQSDYEPPAPVTHTGTFTNGGSSPKYLWLTLEDSHMSIGTSFTPKATCVHRWRCSDWSAMSPAVGRRV